MSEIQDYDIKFNTFLVGLFGACAIFLFGIGTILHNMFLTYSGFIPLAFEWYCLIYNK